MKAVLILLGLLGGIYAAFGTIQFVNNLKVTNPGTGYGAASIAAGVP